MSGGTVIGFHDIKLHKVGGRGANPEGRAELHQAVDEGLLLGQELSCAKEGLCMIHDAQSVTSFGSKLRNVICPKKIMDGHETLEFE